MSLKHYTHILIVIILLGVFHYLSAATANPTEEIIVKEGESIQAAINLAPPGSTIKIMPGRYYERLKINKTLTLIGFGNETVIQGQGTSTTVEISKGVNGVKLMNLTFDGTNTYHSTGLWVRQSGSNQIINVTISNFHKGLRIYDSSRNYLRGVHLINNTYNLEVYGLYLSHFVHDIDLSNTVNGREIYYLLNVNNISVTGNAGYVAIVNSTNVKVANMTLSDNFSGLLLAYTNNTMVYNVSCTRNIQGIRLVNSHNVTVANSSLMFNEWSGLSLEPATRCKVFSNTFKFNKHAIYLSFAPYILNVKTEDNKVFLNEIANNSIGIYFDEVGLNKIYYNNFVGNNVAIKIDEASGNSFFHNNFLDNMKDVDFIATPFSNLTNSWDNGYSFGGNYWSNNIDADNYKGQYQNVSGSDGLIDKPHSIGFNNTDRYPLLAPVTWFCISWLDQENPFEISGNFTKIQDFHFNATLCHVTFKLLLNTSINFCRIGLPKNLLWAENNEWKITLNGSAVEFEIFPAGDYIFLYFQTPNYLSETDVLEVNVSGTGAIPEYSFINVTIVVLLIVSFLIISVSTKKPRKRVQAVKRIAIIMLFIFIFPKPSPLNASYSLSQNTLIVGEDGFKTISEAVENALNGDKIMVRAGTYVEQVTINKSIMLYGENLERTIIETNTTIDTVVINANNVSIRGFTIRNFGGMANSCGVRIVNASGCVIEENLIEGKFIGVKIENGSCRNIVRNNVIKNNRYGMFLMRRSSNNIIFNNSILNNGWNGIELAWYSNNNTFEANTIMNNGGYGIEIPIYTPSYGNNFFHNNFLNNSSINPYGKHAADFFNNSWFFNFEGNFWDNYEFTDTDKNGIGDVEYCINENRRIYDRFPLMGEFRCFSIFNETLSTISSSVIYSVKALITNGQIYINISLYEMRNYGFLRLQIPKKILSNLFILCPNEIMIKNWSSPDDHYIYVEFPIGNHLIQLYGATEIPELNRLVLFYTFIVTALLSMLKSFKSLKNIKSKR